MTAEVKCSICMATRNKATELARTLDSIRRQRPPFEYEIIVADDGSTDKTVEVCDEFGVSVYKYLENPEYRNPSVARNAAYQEARGDVVIAQSDDVIHATPDAIERLVSDLHAGEFLVATVLNWHVSENKQWPQPIPLLTGKQCQRPFFFLGSLWRKDLYAVGGNSEDFVAPAFDDDWFGDCLTRGLKLQVRYHDGIIGHHQHHERPAALHEMCRPSRVLYREKKRAAEQRQIPWQAVGGPWPFEPGRSYCDLLPEAP